jgi:hypothetical protein
MSKKENNIEIDNDKCNDSIDGGNDIDFLDKQGYIE